MTPTHCAVTYGNTQLDAADTGNRAFTRTPVPLEGVSRGHMGPIYFSRTGLLILPNSLHLSPTARCRPILHSNGYDILHSNSNSPRYSPPLPANCNLV